MLKRTIISGLFCFLVVAGYSQTITLGALGGSTFCAGASVSVPYTVGGAPFTAGNVFTAQLSDASGNFLPGVTIGVTGTTIASGTISATIPTNTGAGTLYLIRVISSVPSKTSNNSPTLTINALGVNAPTVPAGSLCEGSAFLVTNNLLNGCNTFGSGNTFTVQLSDPFDNFGAPTTIGSSSSSTPISVTIPGTLPAGTQYRIRIVSSNPSFVSADNGADLVVTKPDLGAPTIPGSSLCAGNTFNITNNLANSCSFVGGNTFSVQLSDPSGSFSTPVTIGTSTSISGGLISVTIPASEPAGTSFRIRVVSSNPAIVGPINAISLTIQPIQLTSPTFTGTNFCGGAAFNVNYDFTSGCPFLAGNVFTAQLSDPTGSFTTFTNIGSVTATGNGSIPVLIPVTVTSGSSYRIRVIGSNPSISGPDNGTNLTMNPTTLNAPTFSGTTFCSGNSFTLNYSGGCNFQPGNVYTAQLSNASGSFVTPTVIGTISATSNGIMTVTLPLATPTGTAYRIRVVTSSPALTSADNGTNLTINVPTISAPTFTGSSFCQSQALTVNYVVTNSCNLPNTPSNNVFTAQLSSPTGSFSSPTNIGTATATGSGFINATIPAAAVFGTKYRIRVISSNPGAGLTSPDNGTDFTINVLAFSTPTVSATTLCQGASVTVGYTLANSCNVPDIPSNNIFTAQLSDAFGAFGSPINIGTLTSGASTGSIPGIIPINAAAGTAYRIRVISSNPGTGLISPNNATAITIKVLAVSITSITTPSAPFCQGSTPTVNYTVTATCGFPTTVPANTFTAFLSDATGSFTSAVNIGTFTANGSGAIPVTIPVTTPAGTGYEIQVVASNPSGLPITSPPTSAFTVNVIGLNTPTITGGATTFCQASSIKVNWTLLTPGSCPFLAGNTFTIQLSDQFRNFGSPTILGSVAATAAGNLTVSLPYNATPGTAYRIRVVASTPNITSPDNGTDLTISTLAINAPTFTGTSFCQGSSFPIAFVVPNSCGFPNTPSANIFTAQLSDASGAWGSPTPIGTVTTAVSGTITGVIPTTQGAGTGYRIRIISTNPSSPGSPIISPDNGTNLTVTAITGNPSGANGVGSGFGTSAWNAFVYNTGGTFPSPLTNYVGFYTENNLNFNTTTRFPAANSPSTADASTGLAYTGCPAPVSPYIISFKRTNFVCGYYTIDIPSHDDIVTIYVNGVAGPNNPGLYGANTNGFWKGFLGANDQVEIQIDNTGGPGNLAANLTTTATPIVTSPNVTICSTASTTLTASSSVPLNYTWSPTTGLNPSTGIGSSVVAGPLPVGVYNYTATGKDATSGCTTTSGIVKVTVSNTTPTVTVTKTFSDLAPSICSGVNSVTLTASGSNTYTWASSPDLSATSGNVVIATPTGTGTRTYTVTGNNGCANSTPVATTITVNSEVTTPSPTTYGNNVWNAYVYDDATFTTQYGFYTENGSDAGGSFNSTTRWAAGSGPWVANATSGLAYTGCVGVQAPWSISFKKTNFTCGYYQIDIPSHDDNLTLIINGTTINTWACCTANITNVWTGFLGGNSQVEWRLVNNSGGGNLQITIAPSPVSPLTSDPSIVVCAGQNASLNSYTGITGVTYAWTDGSGGNSLIACPTCPNTTAGPMATSDNYKVTITDAAGTTCSYSATVPITVNPTANTSVTPTTNATYCPGSPFTLTATGANTYSWTQDQPGSSLNVTDQYQVIATPTVTTTYTVTGNTGCNSNTATTTVTVTPPPPITTFPTGTWNVYGFNSNVYPPNTSTYQGYYTENGSGSGYDFNNGGSAAANRWVSGGAPSTANATNGQAWRGCTMNATSIALSFKRTGFACGLYQFNVVYHDDDFYLLINGVIVGKHNGCCDAHPAIWTGMLNPSSTVEWVLLQGSGGSNLNITIVPQTLAPGTSVWIGSVSTDWFNASNWCSAVPTSTTDAIIPAGAAHMPTIAAAGAQVRTITVSPAIAASTYQTAQPGATLTSAASNNLDVYGSWINGGVFSANTGTVNFTGSNSGNTISNTLVTTFNNVTINKPAGISNSSGLLQIANSLNLTAGVFTDIAGSAAINIQNTGNYTGGGAGSYVDGPLTKTGNVAFTFPVGNGGYFRPISISAPSTNTDSYTAQYFDTNPNPLYPNSARPATIDHISGAEYWTLTRSGGTDNVFVTLSWASPTPSGQVGDPPTLRVARWDVASSKWIDQGNGGTTGSNASGTITTSSLVTTWSTPSSPFALGSTSLKNGLPVELTNFSCTLVAPGTVGIEWTTQSEINNDHFDIERSVDGKNFTKIASVRGYGTTTEVHNYSTKDLNAPEGTVYYKLNQVDINGATTSSEIAAVDNPYSNEVSIYPNPADDSFSINLNGKTVSSFLMMDLMARTITVPVVVTDQKVSVTTSSLTPGIYIVQIVLNGRVYSLKAVKR